MKKQLVLAALAACVMTAAACSNEKPAESAASETAAEETAEEESDAEETDSEETAEDAASVSEEAAGEGIVFKHGGFTFPALESLEKYKDKIYTEIYDEAMDNGLYYSCMLFLPYTEEQLMAITDEEEIAKVQDSVRELFTVIALDGGRGEADLRELLGDIGEKEGSVTELLSDGEYTFFWVEDEVMSGPLEGEAGEMYQEIRDEVMAKKEYIAFGTPKGYSTMDKGDTAVFQTVDMEGNEVDSAELFAEHKITMVNVWTSWCPPCKAELPDLEKINAEFAEKGGAVVGVLYDSAEEGAIDSAKDTIEETGVTYRMLLAPEDAEDVFPVEAYPTTWFFDETGEVVGGPVVGADVRQYRDIMENLLK